MVIEYMKNLVDWNECGYEISGFTYDGENAFALYQMLLPQLVIADLNMPRMSGIELAKKIRMVDSDVEIVFLSGYDDFEYARSAMKLNVYEYILKHELDADVMRQKLSSIKKIIDNKNDNLKKRFESAVRRLFVENIKFPRARLLDFKHYKYNMIIIEKNLPFGQIVSNNQYIAVEPLEKAIQICRKCEFEQSKMSVVVKLNEYRILLLVCLKDSTSQHYKFNMLMSGMLQILKELEKLGSYSIFYFKDEKDIEVCRKAYVDAEHLFLQKYFYKKKLLDMEQLYMDCSFVEPCIKVSGRDIIAGRWDLFDIASEKYDYKTFETLVKSAFLYLKWEYDKLGINQLQSCDIDKLFFSQDIIQWLKNSAILLAEMPTKLGLKYCENINNVILHIYKNFNDSELNIAKIAESFCISESHLRNIFRKETGQNILSFITNCRIENAKTMLTSGKHKILDIAISSGYTSSQYFCRVFKKETGISPMEFKKKFEH